MEFWGFICFVAFVWGIWSMWWNRTPEGKAHLAKLAKNKEIYRLENILEPLLKNPDDSSYSNSIPSLLQKGEVYHRYNYGQGYNIVLDILASNPDKIHLKTLCLELGRKHYANLRPDKKPTIYDEQAIQNDIQVRSK